MPERLYGLNPGGQVTGRVSRPLRNREFGQLVNEARRLIRSEDQYSTEVPSAEAMRVLTTDLHHGASRGVESTEINPGEPS